ncbi:hypothetical protein B566_EDAN014625 [Ephemera danica]|nr:hypothetical protein B566_EDAN014625 [Ephemera danica]
MERLSSTENQLTMVPVYGNMANLCLICANAQNAEGKPFIDIHGQLGTQLKILDKIHKFLTITIEAGFPLQVCVSCVGKLNVCYELVQLSEKAYEKLVSLRGEWEAKKLTDVKEAEPLDDMDDAWSPMDVDVPSPEAQVPVESQDLETDQQPMEESRNKSTENAVEENQLEEYSMLQQPSLLVKGSQIAFVFAEEDAAVKVHN